MNKGAILSLLVAGLVTGSYLEFQANQRDDDVVDVIEAGVPGAPTFTPYSVAPSILNRADIVRAMEREYPPLLRDAGIGGTVRVYFFIDENGRVQDRQIDESSGHQALDAAAMAVFDIYRFSPALNRDKAVPVWVSFSITFQVR